MPELQLDGLTREELVGEIRRARREGQPTLEGVYGQELMDRCEPRIQKTAWLFQLEREDLRDFRNAVHAKIWEKVCGEDPFWLRAFGLGLKHVALNEVRRLVNRTPFEDLDNAPPRRIGRGFSESSNEVLRHVRARSVADMISELPELERTAVRLRYFEDLPIESLQEDTRTVAGEMGVTPRSVRNYLRSAELRLQDFFS